MNAMYKLGSMSLNGRGVPQDETQAARWFRAAAERGHLEAMHYMGSFYSKGLGGLERSAEQAERWYLAAAEGGDVKAMTNLAVDYENQRNYEQAVVWYRKAAERGSARSMAYLGDAYYRGRGVPMDKEHGRQLIERAAEMGSEWAQKYKFK